MRQLEEIRAIAMRSDVTYKGHLSQWPSKGLLQSIDIKNTLLSDRCGAAIIPISRLTHTWLFKRYDPHVTSVLKNCKIDSYVKYITYDHGDDDARLNVELSIEAVGANVKPSRYNQAVTLLTLMPIKAVDRDSDSQLSINSPVANQLYGLSLVPCWILVKAASLFLSPVQHSRTTHYSVTVVPLQNHTNTHPVPLVQQ